MEKQNNRKRGKLRELLDIGKKVLIMTERLKNKDALGILYKSSTENKPFFNRNEIFKINKRVGINGGKTNYYWEKKDGKKMRDRFYSQELFALKGKFE